MGGFVSGLEDAGRGPDGLAVCPGLNVLPRSGRLGSRGLTLGVPQRFEPIRWDVSNPQRAQLWGMPASKRWFFEASEFPNELVRQPLLTANPETLEEYLSLH